VTDIPRRAKIVATLGPASSGPETVATLLEAGMDVVRLNLSHGSHEDHRHLFATVREAAAARGQHVPILMDLMGPRYRLGQLPQGGRELAPGDRVLVGEDSTSVDLPVDEPEFLDHVHPGERFLIDNGLIELEVESREGRRLSVKVVSGGLVSTRKGINLPDSELPFAISPKDRRDVELAVELGADFLGASYVGTADDVQAIRSLSRELGGPIMVVAKLERRRAMHHLEEIVSTADAVMVARGDLGVEVPLHQVPVLQKKIIALGSSLGTPVIVATQMLESMMEHPRPTRAESSDVANAVLDGTDALMLSGETAAGDYPVESVKTMARIVCEAEGHARERRESGLEAEPLPPSWTTGSNVTADTIAASATFAARRLPVTRIVAFSQSGFTARLIARYRPEVEIAMFTTDLAVARRSQLAWGIRPVLLEAEPDTHDEVVELVDRELVDRGWADHGDCLLILMGAPIRERPLTNLLRVHHVR
jgi:pyruvate kinase